MNINNFFVIDVGNTDIVVAIIQNFKIFKIKRFKTIVVKKKNFLEHKIRKKIRGKSTFFRFRTSRFSIFEDRKSRFSKSEKC